MRGAAAYFSELSKDFRAFWQLNRKPRLNYTFAERIKLICALRSREHEADVLRFHVNYLSEGWFRYLLSEIFIGGEYFFEAETDSPVILDCGANIGLATLFFKHLYPKARVSAFEADPTTAYVLQKNIDQNHLEKVFAYNLLLSNAEGEHPFYLATDEDGSPLMSAEPNRLLSNRKIMVKAAKLSHFVDGPVDFLKLDVEGSEFDVLTDLKCTGKISCIRRMVIEYHHGIGDQASRLGSFLALLEGEAFNYQILRTCNPISSQREYQDILIGASRPSVT
jgi:FkbM family methyltransferase